MSMSRMLLSESIQMNAMARWGNRVVSSLTLAACYGVREWVRGFVSSDGLSRDALREAQMRGFSGLGSGRKKKSLRNAARATAPRPSKEMRKPERREVCCMLVQTMLSKTTDPTQEPLR